MTNVSWPTRPSDPAEFRGRLQSLGLGGLADALVGLGRRSVVLVPQPGPGPEAAVTRLGGRPLLPPSTAWPATDEGRPLSFIAQLDCSELAPLLPGEPLPQAGLLSFFYDGVEQAAWGFDPLQSDCWAVEHTPTLEDCVLRAFPDGLDDSGRFHAIALTPRVVWTPPPYESWDVEALGIERPWQTYAPALGESDTGPLIHRLLGHPDPVQGDMQHECQLASNGIYCGDSGYLSSHQARALLPAASEWRLLLQIDSQEDIGMMWGDVGRIYWWTREQDLRDQAWESTWLVLQCG